MSFRGGDSELAPECGFGGSSTAADRPMNLVTIIAYGRPAPQGSKNAIPQRSRRSGLWTGKVRLVESSGTRLATWREVVYWCALKAMRNRARMDGPVCVYITFTVPRPKTVKRRYPTVYPDLDKLERATLDALTSAEVYRDDAQVVELSARKCYPGNDVDVLDTSGAVIHVWEAE